MIETRILNEGERPIAPSSQRSRRVQHPRPSVCAERNSRRPGDKKQHPKKAALRLFYVGASFADDPTEGDAWLGVKGPLKREPAVLFLAWKIRRISPHGRTAQPLEPGHVD